MDEILNNILHEVKSINIKIDDMQDTIDDIKEQVDELTNRVSYVEQDIK